nr:ribonuclease H-like domain-containing protein [Tanacetum cinerariifolium]
MADDEENHALVADEEAPTEFALMAKTSVDSEVFDNSLCSKACNKNTDSLNSKITELTDKLSDTKDMIYHYKLGLSQVEDDLQNKNPSVTETEASPSTISSKPFINFVKAVDPPTVAKSDKKGNSQNHIDDKGYWDSGCSRHMTSNISYLTDYELFDGGRLGHLNCKTMNRLVRHNLVRGLPFKCSENDHTCTACLKGKHHKAS